MNYSATGDFIEKKNIKENFSNSNVEHWSADNLIYTSDGNVGIGTRHPQKKLDVNGDLKANNICMKNASGEETCINASFLILARELILGIVPDEYKDLNILNNMNSNDLKNLIPKDSF